MNTVAKYLRISSEDLWKTAETESVSIVNQRHLLDNYLDTHSEFEGWNRIELCDDGWTGTNFERPGMKELLEMVRKGSVQCIIVKDFSRFGRNYLTVGDYISRVFPFMGVRFISLGDCYDSSRPSDLDSLSVSFSTIIYDLYSKELSGKVKMARDRLAENGDFLAPAAPFGYKKDPERGKHLIVDPDAAETVKVIFNMAGAGKSSAEIARHLNDVGAFTPMRYKRNTGCTWLPWPCISEDNFWTATAVTKILRDERYVGRNIYGKRRRDIVGSTHTVKASRDKWIVTENMHEPIISMDQFNEAQGKLREYREGTFTKASAPLAKKVYCGCCGRAMIRTRAKIKYYSCGTPRYTSEYGCSDERIPEDDILESVLATIRTYARLAVDLDKILIQQKERMQFDRKHLQRKLMVVQSKKEQTERRLQDMYEIFFEGNIGKDEYVSRKQALSGQLTQLAEEIDALEAALSKEQDSDASSIISKYKSYIGIDDLTQDNLRDILDRVTIYPDGVFQIRLNFCDELEKIAENFKLSRPSA